MRGLLNRWSLRDSPPPGTDADLPTRLLAARGLASTEAVEAFCNPSLSGLHDPSAIPDVDRAAERILGAARAGEPIVIYGDYDVDGVTASAILTHTLRAVAPGARVTTYVPHRIDEGYGLNLEAIERLAAEGAALIVTVDCGVTAAAEARAAGACGVDLIITDHHTPPAAPDALPRCFAIVHPGLAGSPYPFRDLSGAGVAFKLAWRIATLDAGSERVHERVRAVLLDMLGLAAMGTVADVVPLLGENRIIARWGLTRLKTMPLPGMTALIHAAGLAGDDVTAEHVGFALGPRLNACGRMGHAREAVELLTSEDAARCREIAASLCALNDQRRRVEREIFERAAAMAEGEGMTGDERRAIVLADESWSPGVVGIACSRLVERFGRPAVLLQRQDGECHGSCRSIDGFDIHAALTACAGCLTSYGGHAMAAGLRLAAERLPEFVERFTCACNDGISVDDLGQRLTIDCEATLEELTPGAVERLDTLAPFGRDNPSPRVLLRGLRAEREAQSMGANGRHLQLHAAAADRSVRLVAWNWGARRSWFPSGKAFDAVVTPRINRWRGRVSVEAELHDVREAAGSAAEARCGVATA